MLHPGLVLSNVAEPTKADSLIERHAIRCGLDFYGSDNVLFGTDCPFDPEGGPMFIRETIKAIDALDISDQDRRKIYHLNALRLMRMPEHEH